MKLHAMRSWLPPVMMVSALAVDVTFLHLPILSFVGATLCGAAGMRQWRRHNRNTAVTLFLIGVGGLTLVMIETGRLATTDAALGRSVADAVRSYTRSTGRAPLRLEDLVPKYLARPPRTRSPLIGKIRYERTNDTEWCIRWGNVPDHAGIECSHGGTVTSLSAPSSSKGMPD